MSKQHPKDLYSILEIEYDATQQRIREMYNYLAKIYHPDINPKTGNLFKEIDNAYNILSNPEKRKEYDLTHNIRSSVIIAKIKGLFDYDYEMNTDFAKLVEETYMLCDKSKFNVDKLLKQLHDKISYDTNSQAFKLAKEYFKERRKEDLFNKEIYDPDIDFPFDWFKEHSYYNNPEQQPIFEILHNFKNYRFENAISSIWKRNCFSIIGVFLVYFISLFYVMRNKIFKKYLPTNEQAKKEYKYKWKRYLLNIQAKNKFWQTLVITIGMFIFALSKIVVDTFNAIIWLFKNVIIWLLIPFIFTFRYLVFGVLIWYFTGKYRTKF